MSKPYNVLEDVLAHKRLEEADKAMQAKHRFSLDDVLDVFEDLQSLGIREKNLTTYFIRDFKDAIMIRKSRNDIPRQNQTEAKTSKEEDETRRIAPIQTVQFNEKSLEIRPVRLVLNQAGVGRAFKEGPREGDESKELQFYLAL